MDEEENNNSNSNNTSSNLPKDSGQIILLLAPTGSGN
jgi:hypothetical protein